MRQIQAIVPSAFKITPIAEKIYEIVKVKPTILRAEANILVLVNVDDWDSGTIMSIFQQEGIGTSFGSLSLTPILAAYPRLNKASGKIRRVSIDELESTIEKEGILNKRFIFFTILAAIVASLGLIADNAIIVLASMIIGPLMGPIISSALGMVLGKSQILKRSLFTELVGISLAIAVGWVMGILIPGSSITSETLLRTSPTIFDFGLALVSSIAIAYSYTYGLSTTLIGLAVSAALLPPATTIGLMMAQNNWVFTLGSSTLLLMNVVTINIIVTTMLWIQKVRPTLDFQLTKARRRLSVRITILILLLGALTFPLFYNTAQSYQNIQLGYQVETITENQLFLLGNTLNGDFEVVSVDSLVFPNQTISVQVKLFSSLVLNASHAAALQNVLVNAFPQYTIHVLLVTTHTTHISYP